MDPNDLLKLLDLEVKPPDAPAEYGVGAPAPARTAPPTAAGPTALEVDEWGLRRGRDLLAESERMAAAGTDEFAAADFFCAAFDPDPRLREVCADPLRHQFVHQLLDTPEYRALHAATRLDDTAAGIAAAHFAAQFAALKKEEVDRGAGGAAAGPEDALAAEVAALRAVGRTVAAAGEEVGELREAAGAFGGGRGNPGRTTRGRSRRCSSGSAVTPRSAASVTWPAGSGGSPGASSGRRRPTGWMTWSAWRWVGMSAGSCPPSWRS